ncbi:cadaverine:lysine antiporter, APA family (TC 2.A.3.2.2) [Maridesulfovibrio ferrireducens]|uniref:Cadaverine:lysine antiporter, APA family (TC 2.A.3.2.2) n=1 Tax=Maridesulfovibrio ferrireducens TaxID=246191 RepID=A0A1G9C9T8_9BACT|nr:amino acid permease [Maridesulfovibrio ferrireducens]SDK48433.1 cadaverine:lysine antiporter, APA family (TC 2.A.3.2.2) [Maridesulfovibrio ferrireducens]
MATAEHKKMGVIACTAVVAGNMMGSGIALLPANLAAIGSISLIGWGVALVGALALAYVFARLGMEDPQEGGPIAYSGEVAPILGYQSGLLYYHANWIGNIAIAITGVDYLSIFFPILQDPLYSGITSIIIIWIFTGINILGADWIGRLVSVGVVLLLIPVIITGTAGWAFFDMAQFNSNWLVEGQTSESAILAAIILCIWSFIGVESASVNTAVVKNPKRTIPISTMVGTAVAGVVYILSCTTISGMFPASTVAASGAPFSLAMGHICANIPYAEYVPKLVSAVTAFACLASLGSWMMLVSQAGCRASNDGTLPKVFGNRNKHGVPVEGLVFSSIMMSVLLVVLMVLSKGGSTQSMFGNIINIAVLLTLPPYFYSALNLLRRYGFKAKKAWLQLTSALLACGFCLIALSGAAKDALIGCMVVMLCTFIFYVGKDRSGFEKKVRAEKE